MNPERLLDLYDRVADAPDAIPRLRRLIFDLSVRGKLVEQDPTDEPASELSERIAAKKRLEKERKINKQKILLPVEQTPFDIPDNWCWRRMRQITSDRGQKIPDTDFTYIDVTAIDKTNGIIVNPKVLNRVKKIPSRARKIVKRGDVIYSCVRPYLLNCAVVDVDFDPPPVASTAFAVLNGHNLVAPRYIWTVLRSAFMIAQVEQKQRGQAYPAINDADFALLPFPLPPLAEQRRIVAKIDEMMALCDELENNLTIVNTSRQHLLKSLVRDALEG